MSIALMLPRIFRFLLLLFSAELMNSCASDSALGNSERPRIQVEVAVRPVDTVLKYSRADWMPGDHWNRQPGSGCLDTRATLLVEESRIPVTMRASGCSVDSGLWVSPYTHDSIRAASGLDVDHLVPLAEANRSGGASWDSAKKNAYANDLAHPEHLIAVDLSSNRSKGDRDPALWMPPASAEKCPYLRDWATVKARWELSMDSAEFSKVRLGLDSCSSAGWSDAPDLVSR